MTYGDLAKEMLRIMNISQPMKDAQIGLVTSAFSLSIRKTWLAIYHWSVGKNLIVKVEHLDIEIKTELWNSTKEICQGKELTKEQMIEVSKALYTIEYWLQVNSVIAAD